MILIKDIKEAKLINNIFLVVNVTKGISSSGAPYLNIQFQDNTGQLEGKKWNAIEDDNQKFKPGNFIEVTGEIIEYKNNWQLKILDSRVVDPTKELIDLSNYIPSAPIAKEVMFKDLEKFINGIQDIQLSKLVKYFFNKYSSEILIAPAAMKIHHEYISGLLHHITSMLKIADAVCGIYKDVNKDLVFTGIILHDLGKIKELINGIIVKYSLEGKLVGHISIMHSEVKVAGEELNIDKELLILVEHIILSHHGKGEHGSPVVPLIVEAEIVSMIDVMDANVNTILKSLSNVEKGEFTSRNFFLNDRSFYKH